MNLAIVTDFTMMNDDGSHVTSNNSKINEFVMHGEQLECSSPLSRDDKMLFSARASSHSMPEEAESSSAFVLVRHGGSIESSAPLSPTDKKLYFRRHSHGSPRLAPVQSEFPSDDWRELPAPNE